MIEYVSGLMFNDARTHVWLLHKQKGPKYLIGRWNGPGGKVQPGESYAEAMIREWREETGHDTNESYWEHFVTLRSFCSEPEMAISVVRFYRAFVDDEEFQVPKTTEEEAVHSWSLIDDLGYMRKHSFLAPNLPVLIALALDESGLLLPVQLKDMEEPS